MAAKLHQAIALAACAACGNGNSSAAPATGSAVAAAKPTASVGSAAAPATPTPPPAAPAPTRDRAAAQAANVRGMQLLTAKKYKEAMAEFRNAIAADDRFVLAHYNLASAASRAHDRGVTEAELVWVKSFAAWDDVAKRANAKIPNDPDLEWFLSQDHEIALYAPVSGLLTDHANEFMARGKYVESPQIGQLLAEAPGKHDDRCDPRPTNPKPLQLYGGDKNPNPPEQGRVHAHVLDFANADAVHERWLSASLRDGLALEEGSRIISRTDPIGCTRRGASQDTIVSLNYLEFTRFAPQGLASHGMEIVRYRLGDDKSRTDHAAIYLFKDDDHIVRVFDTAITDDQDLGVTPRGELVGSTHDTVTRVFQWNEGAAAFEEWRP